MIARGVGHNARMARNADVISIVLADDDPDDRILVREALNEAGVRNELVTVGDGQELLTHLRAATDLPDLVLLDLNMPRMNGREALAAIRADGRLRRLPIIMLTTSKADEDVVSSYEEGANSYITKPVTFPGLVDVMAALDRYWVQVVEMPSGR